MIVQPRCWKWRCYNSGRFNTRISTRQVDVLCVCVCVCGRIRITELLSLQTREHHHGDVGSFPSTPNCSHSTTKKRAVLGQRGSGALFSVSSQRSLTASKQALPIKWWLMAWLWTSPLLSFTLFLATRLRKEIISVILLSPLPHFNHRPLHYLKLYSHFLSLLSSTFNWVYTCWLSSYPWLLNLNVNVTAGPWASSLQSATLSLSMCLCRAARWTLIVPGCCLFLHSVDMLSADGNHTWDTWAGNETNYF